MGCRVVITLALGSRVSVATIAASGNSNGGEDYGKRGYGGPVHTITGPLDGLGRPWRTREREGGWQELLAVVRPAAPAGVPRCAGPVRKGGLR
jgi:hypothetical protein